MAVQLQAQQPLNSSIADFQIRSKMNMCEDLLHMENRENHGGNLFGSYCNYVQQNIINGTVFSEPESELTCNISGSRKRQREESLPMIPGNLYQQIHPQQILQSQINSVDVPVEKIVPTIVSTGAQRFENRMLDSSGTSTSGRPSVINQPVSLPTDQNHEFNLYQQDAEIDALIRNVYERFRYGLEEIKARHSRSLVSYVDANISRRLRQKELLLEETRKKNTKLEGDIKQLAAESFFWSNVAKNNEAIVGALRNNLEQILLQTSGQNKEGFGDSDSVGVLADDAQSYCNNENDQVRPQKRRLTCRSCKEHDVSVLILPCRHLCLCKNCDSKHDLCPICKSVKKASWQIFL